MIEKYLTINKEYGPVEFKEKGSKFISYLFPAAKVGEVDRIIEKLRKDFYDATHVCFAYRIGEGEEKYFRYNDDGEPSGTAGMPIYQEILRKDLFNVLVTVIRYFGGVKLGKGGLQRAYSLSARMIVDSSDILEIRIEREITISIPFNFIGDIMHMVNIFNVRIISQDYTSDGVNMILSIPISKVYAFNRTLVEKSNGKIKL